MAASTQRARTRTPPGAGVDGPRRVRVLRRLGGMLRRNKNRRLRGTAAASPPSAIRAAAGSSVGPLRFAGAGRLLLSLLGLFAAMALSGGGVVALHHLLTRSAHFAIREIRVSPTRHVSQSALQARTGVALGQNLFSVDVEEIARRLRQEPWLQSVEVHRELPSAIAVEVVEREAACAVALGPIYLADARGEVWKRATPDEAAAWPVVTGVPRDGYIHDREASQALIREALSALAAWNGPAPAPRPPVGEIHVDAAAGVTVYTRAGLAVRLGRGDPASLAARLARFDAVASALAQEGSRPAAIYVDQVLHPDRVTVRLASPAGG